MFDVSESAYDNFMGRFSVPLGPVFADFAGIAPGQRVLDVGAGTGALTSELVRRGAIPAAADPSPSFVAALRRRVPGIEVQEAPAEALPWPDESFDAALAQLVITFMRDAAAGVAEMQRVVRPGGVVAVCMWARDGMELELLEVAAAYADFDELWEAIADGAGPAGVWAKSLDAEQRQEARAELFRQVAEPEGPFTLRGRAWAARVTRA